MDANGENETRFTFNGNVYPDRGGNYCPTWSPDGSKIAYTSNVYDDAEILVKDVAGGSPPVRLTDDPQEAGHPAWQPGI